MQTKLKAAKLITYIIPDSCPFARKLNVMGLTIQIPPLCKLNPFYGRLMVLRFNALSYLANHK
jgi:hypothetical protein